MAQDNTYYIDTALFSTATAVWTDAALTAKAPDGWYQDPTENSNIYRQQTGGTLGASANCQCAVACNTDVSASGSVGEYTIDIDTGTDVGAIVVYFQPFNIPDGIMATYDSATFNTLTTNAHGVEIATSGQLNFVGKTGETNCDTTDLQGSTTSVDQFIYSGTAFVDTGNNTNIIIPPSGTVNLNATGNIYYTLVVPKPNASPANVQLKIAGVCSGTEFRFKAICPTALSSFSSSTVESTSGAACSATQNQTFFFAKNSSTTGNSTPAVDTNTIPQVGNFVFSNNTGATPLSDGFVKITAGSVAQIATGVVTAITICGASLTSYSSSSAGVFNNVCAVDGSVFPINQTFHHDGSGSNPTAGDHCYSDAGGTSPLPAGYYQLQPSSTGAGNRTYLQITGVLGQVAASFPQTC